MKHEDTKGTKDFDERLSFVVIGAALEVHRALGPGLLESAYEECVCQELSLRGLRLQRQVPLPLLYKGVQLDCAYKLTFLLKIIWLSS